VSFTMKQYTKDLFKCDVIASLDVRGRAQIMAFQPWQGDGMRARSGSRR